MHNVPGELVSKIETEAAILRLGGTEYLVFTDDRLTEAGYRYQLLPCTCADLGEYGHHFACGWAASSVSALVRR